MAASVAVRRFNVRERSRGVTCGRTLAALFSANVGVSRAEDSLRDDTAAKGTRKNGPKSFRVLRAERQAQAERSVLISCPPKTHEDKFLQHMSQHGHVNKCFFYENFGSYAVVEFSDRDGVRSLLDGAALPSVGDQFVIPLRSRLLTLRNAITVDTDDKKKKKKKKSAPQCQPLTPATMKEVMQQLMSLSGLSQQMVALAEAQALTEEDTRLRFLVCSLLNDVVAPYFSRCSVQLFGSSVNGFGKLGCDLDMFLELEPVPEGGADEQGPGTFVEFLMKKMTSERAVTQSVLSVVADCLERFGPGCVGVQKILNARCPLVRFAHEPSGFQCDLTSSNGVSLRSAELFFLLGELDPRVRPLVFTVRLWARSHGVTSPTAGAWVTNFSLTILVLFFLQMRGILPTVERLKELADPSEKSVVDGNDCTFTTDFSRIHLQTNTDSLDLLLRDFFEFYSAFAFDKMCINFRKGREEHKPEPHPLYIQNFFETSLNVSKNVNAAQLERFVLLCRETVWLLQSARDLPTLFQSKHLNNKRRRVEQSNAKVRSLLQSLFNKNKETLKEP